MGEDAQHLGQFAYPRSGAAEFARHLYQKTDKDAVSHLFTVASSLELTEVLRAVVRLMSDASGVHVAIVRQRIAG